MNACCSGVAEASEVPMWNGGGGPVVHGILTPCWTQSSTRGGAPMARHVAARSRRRCRRKLLPGPPEGALDRCLAGRAPGALLAG